jgi:hypothetical protein
MLYFVHMLTCCKNVWYSTVERVRYSRTPGIADVICMVRRRTARRIGFDENSPRKMYPASKWRVISGRMMMIRAGLSLRIATVLKDLVTSQVFQACRLDCVFVSYSSADFWEANLKIRFV